METIEQRALQVRKHLGLSQSKFAEGLALKQGIISMWETGTAPVSEQNIKMITLIFHVSERWLRTGEGEMFIDKAQQDIKELLDIFNRLSPPSRKMILDLARTMLTNEPPLS
jgi:transcriptional regulator with XRE-family HTH domain